jgi:hypothetical protein
MFEIDESPKNQRVSQLGVIFLTRQCHKNALCTSEHVKICVQFCTNCVDILCGVHDAPRKKEPAVTRRGYSVRQSGSNALIVGIGGITHQQVSQREAE